MNSDTTKPTGETRVAENIRANYLNDLAGIMQTKAGRNVIRHLITFGQPLATYFSPDPYQNAKLSGQREAAVSILRYLLARCPGNYLIMIAEGGEIDQPDDYLAAASDAIESHLTEQRNN